MSGYIDLISPCQFSQYHSIGAIFDGLDLARPDALYSTAFSSVLVSQRAGWTVIGVWPCNRRRAIRNDWGFARLT
jgi:hypothetical protein